MTNRERALVDLARAAALRDFADAIRGTPVVPERTIVAHETIDDVTGATVMTIREGPPSLEATLNSLGDELRTLAANIERASWDAQGEARDAQRQPEGWPK